LKSHFLDFVYGIITTVREREKINKLTIKNFV
jgi:hypothetical protein